MKEGTFLQKHMKQGLFFVVIVGLSGCASHNALPPVKLRKNQVVVQKGDSLYSVAARYHVSPRQLARVNFLSSSQLKPGEVLIIPPTVLRGKIAEEIARTPFVPDTRRMASQLRGEAAQELAKNSKQHVPEKEISLRVVSGEASGFLWPVEGDIVKRFGKAKGALSSGILIKTSLGKPVLATKKGKVAYVGEDLFDPYGLMVIVEHPHEAMEGKKQTKQRDLSVYGHLQKTSLTKGQEVCETEEIGRVGFSGRNSRTPCLYFELRITKPGQDAAKSVDPLLYLSQR